MRPLKALGLSVLLFVGLGCPRNEPMAPIKESGDPLSQLLTSLNVADPRSEPQLLDGFHHLEGGLWRWTEKEFSVVLGVPARVPGHQPDLDVRVTIPGPVEQLLPIELSIAVEGVEAGSYVFDAVVTEQLIRVPIPDGALTEKTALIEFKLDKALGPRPSDTRELGVIITTVAIK